MNNEPVRVAVTGAAGQIGYSLLFRIAAGEMLGPDQPINLQMLEITPALGALEGVAMELDDCAFPLLAGVTMTDDPESAFEDADIALLVGAMPRKAGMERSDLLSANGAIFTVQGRALAAAAKPDVRCPGGGKPGEHQRFDRFEQRPRSRSEEVHRHDTAGSQPSDQPTGGAGRAAGDFSEEDDDLGEPLLDPVSGPVSL